MSGEPAPPSVGNGHSHKHSAPRVRTVLLAEDDDAVREFIRVALEQTGYAVVAAPDGRAAGDLFAADPARFDLVLTDVVMPHVIGPELAARVRKLRPGMPVLFMSAFPGGPGVAPDPVPADERLLEKPFTVATLIGAVNDILCNGRR
jgi:two-component system cell cycle response regulator CpdR